MTPTQAIQYSSMITSGVLTTAAIAVFVIGIDDPKGARSALEREGYTQVVTTGSASAFDCPGIYFMRTSFTAAHEGTRKEGAVCKSLFSNTAQPRIVLKQPR